MAGRRAVVVIVGVALLAAGCSSSKDTSSSAGPGTVSQAGVSVEVPPGAFEPGIKVTVERVPAPEGSREFLVEPVVEIRADRDRQPAHPVTLRFPAAPSGQRLWIAYFDPDSEWWLPVETKTDSATGELVAVVGHFSRWARFVESVQKGASWVEYRGFKALGNRASRPHCESGMPEWVAGELIVNPDENAELFACGDRAGDDVVLKLANNRGYPVTVEFSRPFASSSLSLPTTLGDLVQQVSNPGTSTRLFLVGTGSGEVRFTRPTQPVSGVVEGYARRDGGTMLTSVVFDLADAAGADLPVGGGKTLGVASLECLAAQGSAVSGSVEGIQTRDAGRVGGAVTGLRGCMEVVVNAELDRAIPNSDTAKRLRGAARILRALKIWDFTQQAADAFINDATPEAELVDVSFRWKLPVVAPQTACPATARECLDDVSIRLDGDDIADRLGVWIDGNGTRVMVTGVVAGGSTSTIRVTDVTSIREQSPDRKSLFQGAKDLDGRDGEEAVVFTALGDVGHYKVLTWNDGMLVDVFANNAAGLGAGGYGGFDSETKSLTEQLGFYCIRASTGDYLLVSWTASLRRTGGTVSYTVKEMAWRIVAKQIVSEPTNGRQAMVSTLAFPRRIQEVGCVGADITRPPL